MNNKNYIILLSLFVACTGRAMRYEDLPSQDFLRYGHLPNDQLSAVYAVDKEIKSGVSDLRKANDLTENTVLAKIENALKPYESNPNIALSLQGVYRDTDKVVLSQVPCSGGVYKFDTNAAFSRVALLTYEGIIRVYDEKSRGNWVKHWGANAGSHEYLYLVENGKKLILYDKDCDEDKATSTSYCDLDSEVTPMYGNIINEAKIKHIKNVNCTSSESNFIKYNIDRHCFRRPEKDIEITREGFQVNYTPTLQEIAKYLVSKAQ